MKEILFSIFSVCIYSSIITYLCPDGKGSMKGAVRLVCSLCICSVLLYPIASFVSRETLPSLDLDGIAESNVSLDTGVLVGQVVREITDELSGRAERIYGIKDPILTLKTDTSDPTSLRFTEGTLSGEGEGLTAAAEDFSILLGCPIHVEGENYE